MPLPSAIPGHCYTCRFMQKMLVQLAGKRVVDLHCKQGVPDAKREMCQLHALPVPPPRAPEQR